MNKILPIIITFLLFSSCSTDRKYSIQISKNLYLNAPDHEAVYAFSYPTADGKLLQALRHEMIKPENSYKGGMNYYSSRIYSRASTDNRKSWNILE